MQLPLCAAVGLSACLLLAACAGGQTGTPTGGEYEGGCPNVAAESYTEGVPWVPVAEPEGTNMQYRSMRHTPALAALALAAASPGCEHVVCPAIGFASTVELTLRDDAWQDGVYAVELELTLADDARRCEAEIERRAGAWQLGTLTTACDGEPPQPEVELTATESELRVLVEDSWFHADALVVHVSRDGNELLARATELSYRVTEHPFGEECGGPQRAVVVIEAP